MHAAVQQHQVLMSRKLHTAAPPSDEMLVVTQECKQQGIVIHLLPGSSRIAHHFHIV
jgi:hypothetical protein